MHIRSQSLAVRLFITLMLIIFSVELGIMVLLGRALSTWSIVSVGLLDSMLLAGFLFPILYVLVFRPISASLVERGLAQESLEKAFASIEEQVKERTAELGQTNNKLEVQAKERERAKDLGDTLNEINTAISSTLDFNQIVKMAVMKSTEKLGCKAAAVILCENRHWVFSHVYGLPETSIGAQITDKEAVGALESIETNQVLIGSNADTEKGVSRSPLARANFRSMITVPLIIKGEVIGVIDFYHVVSHAAPAAIEIDFAQKLSASTSMALESARLYATQTNIADTLQEALLAMPEDVEGVEFSHLYRSATTEAAKAGGDFYDLFELEHDNIGLVIGDVSGKGLEAATLTSLVKNTIRAYAYHHSAPAEIVKMTNSVLLRTSKASSFVTLFFGVLDKHSGKLTYCAAGHPPAILKRRAGDTSFLGTGSPVIGAFRDFEYIDLEEKVEKGDILILYTDGVTEAKCDQVLLGEERLLGIVAGMKETAVGDIPHDIVKELLDHMGCTLLDDVALLALSLVER